jgi:hypothetical protein
MAGYYPDSFSSIEEYNGYIRCLTKVKAGYEVLGYTNKTIRPTNHKTDYTKLFTVIGFKKDSECGRLLILGTNDLNVRGFWPMARELDGRSSYITDIIPNWRDYVLGYYAYPSDIRIAKVIPKP